MPKLLMVRPVLCCGAFGEHCGSLGQTYLWWSRLCCFWLPLTAGCLWSLLACPSQVIFGSFCHLRQLLCCFRLFWRTFHSFAVRCMERRRRATQASKRWGTDSARREASHRATGVGSAHRAGGRLPWRRSWRDCVYMAKRELDFDRIFAGFRFLTPEARRGPGWAVAWDLPPPPGAGGMAKDAGGPPGPSVGWVEVWRDAELRVRRGCGGRGPSAARSEGAVPGGGGGEGEAEQGVRGGEPLFPARCAPAESLTPGPGYQVTVRFVQGGRGGGVQPPRGRGVQTPREGVHPCLGTPWIQTFFSFQGIWPISVFMIYFCQLVTNAISGTF